jgi:hypothetical protein
MNVATIPPEEFLFLKNEVRIIEPNMKKKNQHERMMNSNNDVIRSPNH